MSLTALKLSPATRAGFRALLRLAWAQRESMLFGLLALVTTDLCQLMMPQVIGNGIHALFAPGASLALVPPLLMKIAALATVVALFRYLWRHFFFRTARRVERDLRAKIYARLISLSPAYYERTRTGDLMSLLISDLDAVRMTLAVGVVTTTDALLYSTFALAAILFIAPKLALLCLMPLPFIIIAVLYFDGRIESRYEDQQSQISRLTEKVREGLAGVRLLKAYARESEEADRLAAENDKLVERSLRLAKLQALFMPLITFLAGLSLALLIAFGGPALIRGEIDPGEFVKFMLYLGLLTWPMMAVGWTVTLVVRGCVSMHRLEKLLNEIPEIRDPEESGEPVRVPAAPLTLRATDLSFSWPGADHPALDGISFELPPGRHLGIVGGVGSGKTTLLALLQRHYDAQRGTVSLGGVELKALPLQELRRHIAPVAQEAFLFSLSLAENISLGRDGDPAPAAEAAALGGDLRELPQGLATEVGERGVTLSGGQRQRTALARALFNPPQILLLDDTLSAVDAETEAKLLVHLRRDLPERSVVIVAHKLSAVAHCDEILVLERGRIVQRGTHASLLTQPGAYQQLARLQRYLDEAAEKSA